MMREIEFLNKDLETYNKWFVITKNMIQALKEEIKKKEEDNYKEWLEIGESK